jgi:hypothetical protein
MSAYALAYFGDVSTAFWHLLIVLYFSRETGRVHVYLLTYCNVLQILDKLDRGVIMDEVLPLLCEIRLNDINILITVLGTLVVPEPTN